MRFRVFGEHRVLAAGSSDFCTIVELTVLVLQSCNIPQKIIGSFAFYKHRRRHVRKMLPLNDWTFLKELSILPAADSFSSPVPAPLCRTGKAIKKCKKKKEKIH